MRLAHLVKLAVVLWLGRWVAMELASRLARPRRAEADGPLPGRMPDPRPERGPRR